MHTEFTRTLGIEVPLICGAMYPCSNPELVAAASAAGAIGIVQPLSLTYVHGHEFRAGLRYIRRLTGKPIGLTLETAGQSLDSGVAFFVTGGESAVDLAADITVEIFNAVIQPCKQAVGQVFVCGFEFPCPSEPRRWTRPGVEGRGPPHCGIAAIDDGAAGKQSEGGWRRKPPRVNCAGHSSAISMAVTVNDNRLAVFAQPGTGGCEPRVSECQGYRTRT